MTNHSPPRAASRRLATAAVLSSAVVTVLALVVLAVPTLNPYAVPAGTGLLAAAVGPTAMAVGTAVLGLVSLIIAGTARLTARPSRSAIMVTGVAVTVGFGILAQGNGALALAGYLVALAMPVAYVVVSVIALRARHWIRIPLIIGAAVGVTALVLLREAYVGVQAHVLVAFSHEGISTAFTVISFGTALIWGALAVRTATDLGMVRRLTGWATRHRVPLTLLAAAGAAPYPLVRLTWLTPWPLLAGDDLDLGTRIWGVLLSTGAWLGIVLTIGLIRPWGERLPHWFPIGAGRPVHPYAAIIPGTTVSLLVTAAAAPLVAAGFANGEPLLGLGFMPLWFWGPMLGLAVLGYAGHRSGSVDGSRSHRDASTPAPRPSTMVA